MWSASFFSNYFPDREALVDPPSRHGRRAWAWGCGWLVSFLLLASSPTPAQEALRNLLVGDAAAEVRRTPQESLPYTVKSGDFRLLVEPSLDLDWNDNINIAKANALQDFILRPQVRLNASYPLTQNNLLSLNAGAGYDKYFDHDQYSTWFLQSGTELSFDAFVKDFWFNLHDRADYVQDTAQQPELAGTANYAMINNTAGLSVTWDLNKVTLSAGYDHENVFTVVQQYESQDRATEMGFARAGLQVYPGVKTGVEGTAAFTIYDQKVLNNNESYSVGAYADWQPGISFRVQPRVGYTIFQFQHTSTSIQTSTLNSWYADLRITHQVTDAIGYTLDAGHEVRTGIQSDATEDWYVRPGAHWNIIKRLDLNTSFSYEHGNRAREMSSAT
jgi:hypothetical protein